MIKTAIYFTALTAMVLSAPQQAAADVYVGGSVRVRLGAPVMRLARVIRGRVVRVPSVPSVRVVADGYVGRTDFAQPPPPPPPPACQYQCGGPSYYLPAPPVAAVAVPAPRRRRFGLGAFAGGQALEDREGGEAYGLAVRLDLSRHFGFEGELSRTELVDSNRADSRLGAGLVLNPFPRWRLQPYGVAAGGLAVSSFDGTDYTERNPYGELGVGASLNVGRRIKLFADIRGGAIKHSNDVDRNRAVPVSLTPAEPESERYTRGRVGVMLFF